MALRANRVEEVNFGVSSLTASSTGNIDIYTTAINGTIQSVVWEATASYTKTGSIIVYESGTLNNELFNISGISTSTTRFPIAYATYPNGATGSATTGVPILQHVVMGPLRIVGSGLGASASGLNLRIRFN